MEGLNKKKKGSWTRKTVWGLMGTGGIQKINGNRKMQLKCLSKEIVVIKTYNIHFINIKVMAQCRDGFIMNKVGGEA